MRKIFVILLCVLLLLTGCSKASTVAIPDAEAAKAIAQAYFDEMEKDEVLETFVIDDVFYDGEKEAWVVVFWHDLSSDIPKVISTGSLYITIGEAAGDILDVFYGELIDGMPA